MNNQIKERVLEEASHIYHTHDTIRKTAKIYGMSKSTVHNDISVKLRYIDSHLYEETRKILQENFEDKHLRGGEATKQKYAAIEEKESVV